MPDVRRRIVQPDALGRWYINRVCRCSSSAEQQSGIDLGLRRTGNVEHRAKIENPRWYRASEASWPWRSGPERRIRQAHPRQGREPAERFCTRRALRSSRPTTPSSSGMLPAANLARTSMAKSVMDVGWYSFKQQIRYKSIRNGGTYVEVSERNTTRSSFFLRLGFRAARS